MRVCVWGSSSSRTPGAHLDESRELGRLLAEGGHLNINGGGSTGCMGALNQGGMAAGGHIRGVIHEMWAVDGQSFGKDREVGAGRYEEVLAGGPDLTERKQLLAKDAECFIALPGGPGTWEELWEIVCQRQLGLPPPDDESAAGIAPARRGRGPVCLVNVDGFYDGFIATAERAVADGLLHWKGADAVAGPRATAAAGDDAPHLLMHRHTAAAALTCCVKAVALERCLLERAGGGDQAVAGLATHANSPTTVSAALPPPPPPPPAVGGISWTPLRAGLVGGGIGAALGCAVNSGHACTRLIDVRATGPGW